MRTAIDALLLLLSDTEERIVRMMGDGRLADGAQPLLSFLGDFRRKRLNPLHFRQKHADLTRYVVGLVGLTNVGKSTLVEALLGHPVAPSLNGPATSIPVEYEYGSHWTMRVHRPADSNVETTPFPSPDRLAKALRTQVLCLPPERARRISRALVAGPMDLLKEGLVLADTPGFGAAQPDGSSPPAGPHEYALANSHEVLFCLSGANLTVKPEEVKAFEALRDKCSTVVITKWDSEPGADDADAREYEARYGHLFPRCRLTFVEARQGSGVPDLLELIGRRANPDARRQLLLQEVARAWNDLNELAGETLRSAGLRDMPWRRDVLERFLVVAGRAGMPLERV